VNHTLDRALYSDAKEIPRVFALSVELGCRKVEGTTRPNVLCRTEPRLRKVKSASNEDRIRIRANDLYQRRDCLDGHALDDWLEAKAEALGVVRSPAEEETAA
jgi:hypothetical protein